MNASFDRIKGNNNKKRKEVNKLSHIELKDVAVHNQRTIFKHKWHSTRFIWSDFNVHTHRERHLFSIQHDWMCISNQRK